MSVPSVTKDDGFSVYRVRAGHGDHEWATIAVRERRTKPDSMCGGERRECGEILIYSSFGSWGHQWGHLGTPFRRWLLTCEFDYVFTKFMGVKLHEFDGDGSIKALRERVIEYRRHNGWSKETARAAWEAIEEAELEASSSEHDFVEAFQRVASDFGNEYSTIRLGVRGPRWKDLHSFFAEPWELTTTRHNLSARGFWRDIWPVFINHLKAELAEPATSS